MATSHFDPEFIERIVQEVLRRLREAGGLNRATTSLAGELSLDEKVVSLETLRGRLDGVRRIVVAAKAVVTPAVKDELNDRQIELARRQEA